MDVSIASTEIKRYLRSNVAVIRGGLVSAVQRMMVTKTKSVKPIAEIDAIEQQTDHQLGSLTSNWLSGARSRCVQNKISGVPVYPPTRPQKFKKMVKKSTLYTMVGATGIEPVTPTMSR
jgi:hypothetical protein